MPSKGEIGQVKEQVSPEVAHSLFAMKAISHGIPADVPLLPNISFTLDQKSEIKQWTWGEWFIPPIGSGRTIIDLRWRTVLTLVRTTDANGNKIVYLNINVNPGILAWNLFVQGSEPHLHARILEVGIDVDYGTFPGGCGGVITYFDHTVQVRVDVFDAANTAQLTMTAFSFVYC
jgi:hypothetical protein